MAIFLNNNKGLSLIEVLIAGSVFIIGLMAMLTSSVALLSAARFSKNHFIATELSREAIEVVKNKRDQNYIDNKDFNDGLKFASKAAVLKFFGGQTFTGEFYLEDAGFSTLEDCISNSSNCDIWFSSSKGMYGDIGDKKTIFYRIILFNDIKCKDTVPSNLIQEFCGGDIEKVVGLEAVARTAWYRKDNMQYVDISTRLYDWR